MHTFESLPISNQFAGLPPAFYQNTLPTPLPQPRLLHFNALAAELIQLDPDQASRADAADYLSGNRLLPGSQPVAALYAGHQFGYFVPQLGDGRALLLGDAQGSDGAWELQLKGAGPTPFSRGSDGRAVLRSSIREYLCSEAMFGLGIPTTRALSLVGSSLPVYRESEETAAIVMRMSPSFLRFGSFEVFFYRSQPEQIRTLADFVIAHHYPQYAADTDKYPRFFGAVVASTAKLMAQWQAVGFSHGVMNTDNMSLLGLTLDYGPFGFLDHYDPGFICNHSDEMGRYAFDQQPDVGAWNLTRLAQALTPLMSVEAAKAELSRYPAIFASTYINLMCAKLGLPADKDAISLITPLLDILAKNRIDYTIFMRGLCDFTTAPGNLNAPLRDLFIDRAAFDAWAANYRARLLALHSNDAVRAEQMRRVNPKYILRNYLAEKAIEAAREHDDMSEIDRLMRILQTPYDEHPDMEIYAAPPPDWAQHISVSCSS
ncbi:MAG: protein adenylyltransferase SelO [Sulfuriferula sp.]